MRGGEFPGFVINKWGHFLSLLPSQDARVARCVPTQGWVRNGCQPTQEAGCLHTYQGWGEGCVSTCSGWVEGLVSTFYGWAEGWVCVYLPMERAVCVCVCVPTQGASSECVCTYPESGLCVCVPTQGAVALHAPVGGAALHGADDPPAHQHHAHVAAVRLLHVLLEEVWGVVADQVAQVREVVLVPGQEHRLAWVGGGGWRRREYGGSG